MKFNKTPYEKFAKTFRWLANFQEENNLLFYSLFLPRGHAIFLDTSDNRAIWTSQS